MPVVTFGSNTGNTYGGDVDTRFTEASPTTNYGSGTEIVAADFGAGDHSNFWQKFDFSQFITDLAGQDITINSLTLGYYSDGATSTVGMTVTLYPCLRSVVESEATWDDYQAVTAWTTGGGQGSGTDRGATPLGTVTITSGAGYDTMSGSAFNTWLLGIVNDGNTNNGIISDYGDTGSGLAFWPSSEGTDGQRPVVTLDYSLAGGGGSANLFTGKFGSLLRGKL